MSDLQKPDMVQLARQGMAKTIDVSTQLNEKTEFAAIRSMVERSKDKIASVLPKHISADRMLRIALGTISKNDKLLKCTPTSIVNSLLTAAQLGLEVGGPFGYCHLVPFWNNKISSYECSLIPGFQGLIDLARRSGKVKKIEAHIVHAKDEFEIAYGDNPTIKHIPAWKEADPGEPLGVYSIAFFDDGVCIFELLNKSQVDAIKRRALEAKHGAITPWDTDEYEMWRKTAVRRLSKYLPKSSELALAMHLQAQAEAGQILDVDYTVDEKEVAAIAAERETESTKTDALDIAHTQRRRGRPPKVKADEYTRAITSPTEPEPTEPEGDDPLAGPAAPFVEQPREPGDEPEPTKNNWSETFK